MLRQEAQLGGNPVSCRFLCRVSAWVESQICGERSSGRLVRRRSMCSFRWRISVSLRQATPCSVGARTCARQPPDRSLIRGTVHTKRTWSGEYRKLESNVSGGSLGASWEHVPICLFGLLHLAFEQASSCIKRIKPLSSLHVGAGNPHEVLSCVHDLLEDALTKDEGIGRLAASRGTGAGECRC